MDSILTSVKTQLGIIEEYTHFDPMLIVAINTVLMELTQIGVGPSEGYMIEGEGDSWDDFLGGDTSIEAVKTLVALKVRLIFDPPQNSVLTETIQRTIDRLEWRVHLNVNPVHTEAEESEDE